MDRLGVEDVAEIGNAVRLDYKKSKKGLRNDDLTDWEDGRRQDDPIHLRQGKPARQLDLRRKNEIFCV